MNRGFHFKAYELFLVKKSLLLENSKGVAMLIL